MGKHWTGVGSRATPDDIARFMEEIAFKLSQDGWVLRSGGANGADKAFQAGASNSFAPVDPEIYMPWYGFNGLYKEPGLLFPFSGNNSDKAYKMAEEIHPNWEVCSQGAKALHARNIYQILGINLDEPSKFLICWAKVDKHGVPQGGTRSAWVLAKQYNVPCFNLIFPEHFDRISAWMDN